MNKFILINYYFEKKQLIFLNFHGKIWLLDKLPKSTLFDKSFY